MPNKGDWLRQKLQGNEKVPLKNLTHTMKTALRLLAEGDLVAVDFNVWTLKTEGSKPAPGRFVAAVIIRKLLSQGLAEPAEDSSVRMSEKGTSLYAEFPEVRHGRVIATKAPRSRLRQGKPGRSKGVTVYCFAYAGRPYAFTTSRDVTHQVRMVQAQAWRKNPDQVPVIQVTATRMNLLSDENAAIVLRDGIDALIAEKEVIDFDPVQRKGFYRHYLAAQQKSTGKPKGERRASKHSATQPTVDPTAPDAT